MMIEGMSDYYPTCADATLSRLRMCRIHRLTSPGVNNQEDLVTLYCMLVSGLLGGCSDLKYGPCTPL